MISIEQLDKLGDLLANKEVPLKARHRILFTLKNLGGDDAVRNISKAFNDKSALLKHECAYCLGQMQNKSAIPILIDILNNKNEDPMVRHEAGEALGAIGDFNNEYVVNCLKSNLNDTHKVVSETCELALNKFEWLNIKDSLNENLSENPYQSVDPAPPFGTHKSIKELHEILLNENDYSLFDRYRAMFSLRNIGTNEAILALCDGLKCKKSALFRHEIAYVLGQIQNELSIPALTENLSDTNENYMVRHECAETIGSLANDYCTKILEKFLNDNEIVVKESCEVALDITDYANSSEFQYANGLLVI